MSLYELVATGPQAGQRWRQTLEPGRKVRIGRAPAEGWAVSWDMRISREHCDLQLEGDRLKVRCLESALNPAHLQGQALREFTVGEGESFRIGATTFHMGRRTESLSDDESAMLSPALATAVKPTAKVPVEGKPEQGNSSIRRLKDEVEQLKAKLASETEAKRKREEDEQRRKADEVAALKAQVEQMKKLIEPQRRRDEDEARLAAEEDARRKEEARLKADEEARQRAEEAQRKAEEESRRKAEEEARLREEAEARQRAEEEARRKAQEEARKRAEEEARCKAEEEARRKAQEEARKRAEEEARLRAEEQARRRAEEEARKRAAEEARQRAEEQARRKAEEEARRKAEEEARRKAEEEARRKAEEEARRKAEEEARRKAEEEARRRAEEEVRRRAEEEARLRAEEEARQRAEEEARRRAEEEARLRAEEEARQRAEEEARRQAEEEARRKAKEEEAARRHAEAKRRAEEAEAKRKALEAEARRLAEEAEALRLAEEEAQRQAEAEERRLAEEEARRLAEEEARRKAEAEARRRAEEEHRRQIEAEAAARRAAEQAEAKRRHEEAEAKRRALEAEARRLAEEAEALRRAEEEAARLAEENARREAEEVARRLAEEEARLRAEEEARRQAAEEERRQAEAEAAAKRAAEHAAAERRAAEAEARRRALEEEAKRLAAEAEAVRLAEEEAARQSAEDSRQRAAAETEAKSPLVELEPAEPAPKVPPEKATLAEIEVVELPPKAPPEKSTLADLKAKLAADAQSEAKRPAKKAPPVEAPAEAAPAKANGDVAALKAQLAAQAAAKREEKKAAAPKPAAPPGDPGKKKLDLAALKAELEAKKAARKHSPDGGAAPEVGRASEERYESELEAQLNKRSASPRDASPIASKPPLTQAPKPSPKPTAAKPAAAKPGKPVAAKTAKDKEAQAAALGDNPHRYVWKLLPEAVRETVRKVAAGAEPTPEDKLLIVTALNQLLKDREFLSAKALEKTFENERVTDVVKTFPKGTKGIKKDWSELEIRAGGRLVLQVLYPTTRTKKRKRKIGPPRILAYLSRSDIFGEMGALLNQPRSATCVAYDHPPDDSSRKPGRVELVRIGTDVFQDLIEASPGFRDRVERLIEERQQRSVQVSEERPWDENSSLKSLPEFEQLGLVQGQKLMLIDLDRCTRCGDCVRACINTHDDGYSRLFLDGPRFDRFLVPSACRKCLNPSCMIGCPVGSIQRGDSDEIIIRDWCIGCGLCARQCPYDSIQMHDLGVIPEKSLGWRFQLGSAVTQANWNQAAFRDGNWPSGPGPFPWDLNLQLPLSKEAPTFLGVTLEEAVFFRYEFEIAKHMLRGPRRYRLFLVSTGSSAQVWINGQAVDLPQDAKQKKKGEYEGNLSETLVRPGKNLVAVAVQPPVSFGEMVLSLRLDMPPELTGDAALANELKLVTEKAVVCDMCGTRPGGPACVAECPHDAAMRVDAQREFPRS